MPGRRSTVVSLCALIALVSGLASRPCSGAETLGSVEVGSRVRVQAPALGSGWREGMLNRTRTAPGCYHVLVFKPRPSRIAAMELESMIKIGDVTRMAVFTGSAGPMQDWVGRTTPEATEADWREVDLAEVRAATGGDRC
jgi:hypothetical protein